MVDLRYSFIVACHLLTIALLQQLEHWLFPQWAQHHLTIAYFVAWFVVSYQSFHLTKKWFLSDRVPVVNKAVFITGCDTGFGHLLAKRLHSKGYFVFAGCLNTEAEGAAELNKNNSSRFHVIPLDVTSNESVARAKQYVNENLQNNELWAVVNNAGISYGLSVELSSIKTFEHHMDVNCMGQIRITKAFLPLLKKSKGRIVNVISVLGSVAAPFLSPYITSKFAATGFSESLRCELQDRVTVITLEPDLFRTNLITGEKPEFPNPNASTAVQDRFEPAYIKSLLKIKDLLTNMSSTKLDLVIDDMESAISLVYPDAIYKTRKSLISRFLIYVYGILPSHWKAILIHSTMPKHKKKTEVVEK